MRPWALTTFLLLSCKSAPSHRAASTTTTADPVPTGTWSSTDKRSLPPALSAAPEAGAAAAPSGATLPRVADGSAPACRALRGPIELPLRAPASLTLRGDKIDVLLNEDGRPRVVSFSSAPMPLNPVPAGREPVEGDRATGLAVPCAAAAERVFCPERSGAVHRTTPGQSEDRIVASSRPQSRIAAATLGDAHVALGYLASRQTSEGWVSEAWLAVDDQPPRRLSEDGSGATALALAARGPGLLALMIDARTALTAMHARPVLYDSAVRLGEDAVVFVGGPGDRRTRGALAVPSSGPAWALLPIAKDVASFGLAIVRVDEPPRVDEPVVWSAYPNGLDPAPIAAAWDAARGATAWVARVRPVTAEPSSTRVLELGQVAPDGAFAARDVIATSGNPTDTALAVDPHGTLWLAWVDGSGSWLERLACH